MGPSEPSDPYQEGALVGWPPSHKSEAKGPLFMTCESHVVVYEALSRGFYRWTVTTVLRVTSASLGKKAAEGQMRRVSLHSESRAPDADPGPTSTSSAACSTPFPSDRTASSVDRAASSGKPPPRPPCASGLRFSHADLGTSPSCGRRGLPRHPPCRVIVTSLEVNLRHDH